MERERLPRGADPATHTKLGRGGLSDVEWTVQLLQLQHAAEVPALRTPSTVDGLAALGDAGLLDAEQIEALQAAWELATRARNAIFLVRGRPSDQLPRPGPGAGRRRPRLRLRPRPGRRAVPRGLPPHHPARAGRRGAGLLRPARRQADALRAPRVWRVAGGRSTLVAARTAVAEGDTGERLRPVAEVRMSPTLARSVAAEFLGTALLVFVAVGSAVAGIDAIGEFGVAFAFGLTLLALAYAIGPISGCHINPAVTLGVLLSRGMTATEAAYYWVAQFAGGIAGAAVLQLLTSGFGDMTDQTGALGANDYGATISLGGALVLEVLLTFVFVAVILLVTGKAAAPGFAGLAIGLTLTAVHLIGIPLTGTSVNPARSLGPALFAGGEPLAHVWVFIARAAHRCGARGRRRPGPLRPARAGRGRRRRPSTRRGPSCRRRSSRCRSRPPATSARRHRRRPQDAPTDGWSPPGRRVCRRTARGSVVTCRTPCPPNRDAAARTPTWRRCRGCAAPRSRPTGTAR